jgi:hypothetical protein
MFFFLPCWLFTIVIFIILLLCSILSLPFANHDVCSCRFSSYIIDWLLPLSWLDMALACNNLFLLVLGTVDLSSRSNGRCKYLKLIYNGTDSNACTHTSSEQWPQISGSYALPWSSLLHTACKFFHGPLESSGLCMG